MRTRLIVLVMLIMAGLVVAAVWPIASYGKATPAPQVNEQASNSDAEEFIDLLWWLRRGGPGGWGFAEIWNNWENASGYFHGGPSR